MGDDDTVARFRQFLDFPDLFRHWSLARWQYEGRSSILEEAWDRAQSEMAAGRHRLDDTQARQVAAIYDGAVTRVKSMKTVRRSTRTATRTAYE